MSDVAPRPVQARSVATRTAVLDAAVDILCTGGYGVLTTSAVGRRAGVSRGALLHHFPTRAALVAAAVEHLLGRRLAEFRAALEGMAPLLDSIDAAVDLLWSMFESPTFAAWVEVWMAARTDADLAATVTEVDRRFTEESRLLFLEMAANAEVEIRDPGALELARDVVFATMTGVSLQRLVPRGQRPASDYLDALKAVVPVLMADPLPPVR